MLTISQQLRLFHVKRWGMVMVSREQSVAEHSYNVALIARDIINRLPDSVFNGIPRSQYMVEATEYALHHDMLEVLTGDTPTPYKRILKDRLGETALDKVGMHLDLDLHNFFKKYEGTLSARVVGVADLMEAAKYISMFGVGDHAFQVKCGLVVRMLEESAKFDEPIRYVMDQTWKDIQRV